jgi:hypothetical protein
LFGAAVQVISGGSLFCETLLWLLWLAPRPR